MKKLEYRCRRCQRVFFPGTSMNAEEVGKFLEAARGPEGPDDIWVAPKSNPLDLFAVHRCGDKGIGISDLIGLSPPY